jgi:hypothetical protein
MSTRHSIDAGGTEDNDPNILSFWPEALLWSDKVRGLPNVVLRSPLFGISRNYYRVSGLQLSSYGGVEVRFTGERLNQMDLDTWEMLLHLRSRQPSGGTVEFEENRFLESTNRGTGGVQKRQLKDQLIRLLAGAVVIEWPKEDGRLFAQTLIQKFSFSGKKTGRYTVTFHKDILDLYGKNDYTQVDCLQRGKLRANNLAQWLHAYYSSHARPYPHKVQTLQDLSGSKPYAKGHLNGFRRELKKALDAMLENGSLLKWNLDKVTDLVTVVRGNVSQSQMRHLERKTIAEGEAAFDGRSPA